MKGAAYNSGHYCQETHIEADFEMDFDNHLGAWEKLAAEQGRILPQRAT